MGLIHEFYYGACGHKTKRTKRVCSACPEHNMKACKRLRIIRNDLKNEYCKTCFFKRLPQQSRRAQVYDYFKPTYNTNFGLLEATEAKRVLSRALEYLKKHRLCSCIIPGEKGQSLHYELSGAISYIFWLLNSYYWQILKEGKLPGLAHREIILHLRGIIEQNIADEIFREHFPPSRTENLISEGILTPLAEPTKTEYDEEEDGPCCAICQMPFTAETAIKTRCNHEFGSSCLFEWLEDHGSCPICRAEITREFGCHCEYKSYLEDKRHASFDPTATPTWIVTFLGCTLPEHSSMFRLVKLPFEQSGFLRKVVVGSLGEEWHEEEKDDSGLGEDPAHNGDESEDGFQDGDTFYMPIYPSNFVTRGPQSPLGQTTVEVHAPSYADIVARTIPHNDADRVSE